MTTSAEPNPDLGVCQYCRRDSCDDPDHLRLAPPTVSLDATYLADSTVVAAEGRELEKNGIRYVVKDLVPAFGTLGMLVAYTKVGKTTFSQHLGAAVASGTPFLGRETQQRRVLVIAAEDPPEYTAYLARHFTLEPGALTFYRAPIQLDATGLARIVGTIQHGGYGLVLIASWQAVVSEIVRDENDNAGAVRVVERVKHITRQTGIPWLVDAHSGKGEDQSDDADPGRAMRGASGAASAADYTLSLRYTNGAFGTQRRFSGKGRFVFCPPLLIDYDGETGRYTTVSGTAKDAAADTTWRLLQSTGAVDTTPKTTDAIARAAGLVVPGKRVTNTQRRQVSRALYKRDGVQCTTTTKRGQSVALYTLQLGAV